MSGGGEACWAARFGKKGEMRAVDDTLKNDKSDLKVRDNMPSRRQPAKKRRADGGKATPTTALRT